MVWILSFLLVISHVYTRQKKQFWECPVWWVWRGHLLSAHTWDPGPAMSTLPPTQCDNTWQYVTIPRVCGDHCSCNVTRSINMFYPVLINTHTAGDTEHGWPASEVCHTQLTSCQQHFLGSGPLTIMTSSSDMHQTTMMTTFSRLLVMARRSDPRELN